MAAVLVWCELEWAWSLDTSEVLRTQQPTVIGVLHKLDDNATRNTRTLVVGAIKVIHARQADLHECTSGA